MNPDRILEIRLLVWAEDKNNHKDLRSMFTGLWHSITVKNADYPFYFILFIKQQWYNKLLCLTSI